MKAKATELRSSTGLDPASPGSGRGHSFPRGHTVHFCSHKGSARDTIPRLREAVKPPGSDKSPNCPNSVYKKEEPGLGVFTCHEL